MSEIKPNYALATLWVYIATYKNRASGNRPIPSQSKTNWYNVYFQN